MAIDLGNGDQDGDEDKYACWYTETKDLAQGSLLRGVRVWEELPNSTAEVARAAPRRIDAIVLTQSCDILKPGQARLLIAEIQSYRAIAEQHGQYLRSSKYRKELTDGLTIAEFLLPPARDALDDWSIANFRELHNVNRSHAINAESFIGLDSPYREHLGQAFARFMMRVGLPTGIGTEFEKDFKF